MSLENDRIARALERIAAALEISNNRHTSMEPVVCNTRGCDKAYGHTGPCLLAWKEIADVDAIRVESSGLVSYEP